MSGCINCGASTPNRRCRDCELAERFEADDPETFDTEATDDDIRTDGGAVTHEKNYCTWGPATLYDLLEFDAEEIPSREPLATEYQGLHLIRSRKFITVQPDGHVGSLDELDPDDYGDVLELVNDLNRLVSEWRHLQEQGLKDRVEAAGKVMTRDPAKARENEALYIHIPEDTVQDEGGDADR